jgi:hypothetical protein
MDTSKIIKTKTLKVNSENYQKVRIKLKLIEIDFTFFNSKNDEIGFIYCLGLTDNEKFIKSLLLEHKVSKESITEIIDFLNGYYTLNVDEKLR